MAPPNPLMISDLFGIAELFEKSEAIILAFEPSI